MPEKLNILFHGEVQLMDWGETRSGGPYIKLRMPDPDHLDVFRGMDTATLKKAGHILNITISQGDIIPAESEPGIYGQEARALHQSGFCGTPDLWPRIGDAKAYELWVSYQPSWISGNYNEIDGKGDNRNPCCHVRRIERGSGTAFKPDYWCVPMTNGEHGAEHHYGETGCLDAYKPMKTDSWSEEHAESEFDKAAYDSVCKWAWETLKKKLGYDHWNEVPPDTLYVWCLKRDLAKYLPREYKADDR